MPLPRLYTAFTRALLRANVHDLHLVFDMVHSADRLADLPSWCPDYGQLPIRSAYSYFLSSKNPSSGSKFGNEDDMYEPTLNMEGARLDAIGAVTQAFELHYNGVTTGTPDEDCAAMSRWLDACWVLMRRRRVEDTAQSLAFFTSIILAQNTDLPSYPDNAVQGLRALWEYVNDRASLAGVIRYQWELCIPVLERLHNIWRNHIFFSTARGDFGIATHRAQVGDAVCMFFDDGRKYLLRPSNEAYEFVSNPTSDQSMVMMGLALPDQTRPRNYSPSFELASELNASVIAERLTTCHLHGSSVLVGGPTI